MRSPATAPSRTRQRLVRSGQSAVQNWVFLVLLVALLLFGTLKNGLQTNSYAEVTLSDTATSLQPAAEEDLLLRGYTIAQVMDCIADPKKNRIIAEFWDDVSAAFPYLNSVVPNLMYNPGANTITAKRGARILTFYPHVAVMAKVDGKDDAEAQLRWFQELCNDVWRRRGAITPSHERRQRLGPLDTYMLLPKLLNCRACGEASCWAFAFRLLFGELSLDGCPRLSLPEYAEGGRRLAELL